MEVYFYSYFIVFFSLWFDKNDDDYNNDFFFIFYILGAAPFFPCQQHLFVSHCFFYFKSA